MSPERNRIFDVRSYGICLQKLVPSSPREDAKLFALEIWRRALPHSTDCPETERSRL